VISRRGYRGDAVKSKATGTLSADAVNAHTDASLIKRIFRARPLSHSYAILSPPSGNEAFREMGVESRKTEGSDRSAKERTSLRTSSALARRGVRANAQSMLINVIPC
jgi:hypothetical protein